MRRNPKRSASGSGVVGVGPRESKRRRTNPSVAVRAYAELQASLALLHSRLDNDGAAAADDASAADVSNEMVIIRAVDKGRERDFRCVRSLIASASRPLAAMLIGSDGLHMQESAMSVVTLQDTDPDSFELLVRYVHGKPIDLDRETAAALFTLCDFYDVRSLCDQCCTYLESCVRPESLHEWWELGRWLECERLCAQCAEVLRTDFMAVASSNPSFTSLSVELMLEAVSSSALVCTKEDDVWDVVQRWAAGQPDEHAQLRRLAQHVRWPLMHADSLSAVRERIADCAELDFLKPLIGEAMAYQTDENPPTPSVSVEPRKYLLGELVVVSRDGRLTKEALTLQPKREYTIGRSRRADIIFSNPFVSSLHCRIWSSADEEPAEGSSRQMPQLQPRLTDLSSNGTYVNGEFVGRDKTVTLKNGDRIGVVRPQTEEAAGTSMGYVVYRHRTSPLIPHLRRSPEHSGTEGEATAGGGNVDDAADGAALTPDA